MGWSSKYSSFQFSCCTVRTASFWIPLDSSALSHLQEPGTEFWKIFLSGLHIDRLDRVTMLYPAIAVVTGCKPITTIYTPVWSYTYPGSPKTLNKIGFHQRLLFYWPARSREYWSSKIGDSYFHSLWLPGYSYLPIKGRRSKRTPVLQQEKHHGRDLHVSLDVTRSLLGCSIGS